MSKKVDPKTGREIDIDLNASNSLLFVKPGPVWDAVYAQIAGEGVDAWAVESGWEGWSGGEDGVHQKYEEGKDVMKSRPDVRNDFTVRMEFWM